MNEHVTRIPMFPLAILPIPGELVPLHIFEPRYRQLLEDMETKDITFGIYFSHEINTQKVGSLMRLESVIKKYPTGESDIIVKCENYFYMDLLLRKFNDRLYPGGDVRFASEDLNAYPRQDVYELFANYLERRNIKHQNTAFNVFQIANELNLDLNDRYKFLTSTESERINFIQSRTRFLIHLLKQEERSKDVFHLN